MVKFVALDKLYKFWRRCRGKKIKLLVYLYLILQLLLFCFYFCRLLVSLKGKEVRMSTLRELAAPNLETQPMSITYPILDKPLKLNDVYMGGEVNQIKLK